MTDLSPAARLPASASPFPDSLRFEDADRHFLAGEDCAPMRVTPAWPEFLARMLPPLAQGGPAAQTTLALPQGIADFRPSIGTRAAREVSEFLVHDRASGPGFWRDVAGEVERLGNPA